MTADCLYIEARDLPDMRSRDESREIGVGMLGYASMGKAHSRAYKDMSTFFYPLPVTPRLAAIFGRTEQRVREAQKKYGYKKYYTDWRKLLADPEVGLIDNGLPNCDHLQPCVEAAEKGRHVICEKPLATSCQEALEMYKAAEKASVKHATAFNYRWLPTVRLAKRMIDRGDLGKIRFFRAAYFGDWAVDPNVPLVWRFSRKTAGSGALGDIGSHIVDMARFLVGEAKEVCGASERFVDERPLPEDPEVKGSVDVDDLAIAMIRFRNGAVGSLEASWALPGRRNSLVFEVWGAEGLIRFNLERLNELTVHSHREDLEKRGLKTILVTEEAHPYYKDLWPSGATIGWADSFTIELHEFLRSIAEDRPFKPSFYDGAVTCAILDSIEKSVSERGWVDVPLVPE